MTEENSAYKITLEHRMTKLETTTSGLRDEINTIKTNHLPHIQGSIDELKESFDKRMFAVMVFLIVTLCGVVIDLALRLFPSLG